MPTKMRTAIATERGESNPWDFKYAAGGLVDLEFIAQYLQLVHADKHPGNSRYIDGARARARTRLGLVSGEDSEVLRRRRSFIKT